MPGQLDSKAVDRHVRGDRRMVLFKDSFSGLDHFKP
jgi:hypothetical protein